MKKYIGEIGGILITIACASFLLNVIYKVTHGHAFERYRTVWLYEMDYFSVSMIFLVSITVSLLYYFGSRINQKRIEHELKDQLNEKRNKPHINKNNENT